MKEPIRHPGEEEFYQALMTLKSIDDCRTFFEDVCTIKELQAITQRFRVACLLHSGRSYLEVSETTGASSATISRVNRCLQYGEGYQKALQILEREGKLDEYGYGDEQ